MSSIYTLEADIRELLNTKGWLTDSLAKELSDAVATRLKTQFSEDQKAPSLRLSQMGPRCPKALWLSIHSPDVAERLPNWTQCKFSIGHFWEAYALMLCKAAGHTVEGEQHELVLDGIKGHCDAIVDGALVDFKSSSSRQFNKIKSGLLEDDDPFGYLDQLDGYVVAGREDPLLTIKDRGFIVTVDKQMGHLHVHEHRVRDSIRQRIKDYKNVVARTDPPSCTCETAPYGASGNIKLGTRASYSAYKWECFPGLRCFVSSQGPLYLSRVLRKPEMLEVDKDGNIVYN